MTGRHRNSCGNTVQQSWLTIRSPLIAKPHSLHDALTTYIHAHLITSFRSRPKGRTGIDLAIRVNHLCSYV